MLVVNLLFASHKRTVGFVFGTRVAAIAVNVPPPCGAAHRLPRFLVVKRLFIAFNLLALLTCKPSDNAYAQHGGGPLTGAAATRTFAALQRYSPDDSPHSQQLAVPENISVGPKYRSSLETMLARSASFRRQCSRIANEDSLTIHVRIVTVPLTHAQHFPLESTDRLKLHNVTAEPATLQGGTLQ